MVQLYPSNILLDASGNQAIREYMLQKRPLLVSRLGLVELNGLIFYIEHRRQKIDRLSYPLPIMQALMNNAGFFPMEDSAVDNFCELYLQSIQEIDILGIWFHEKELKIFQQYCSCTKTIGLNSLDAFLWEDPWTSLLSGQRVLVIHPFTETIENQYRQKREYLFEDKNVLPKFTLITFKAIQTIAGNTAGFNSWFDAYGFMCQKIQNIEFDIAIIGAGAYGLPLGAFIKRLNKQVIHMGGSTQLLFGIIGKRWEREYPYIAKKFFNDYWVRPSKEERPKRVSNIENGCYW